MKVKIGRKSLARISLILFLLAFVGVGYLAMQRAAAPEEPEPPENKKIVNSFTEEIDNGDGTKTQIIHSVKAFDYDNGKWRNVTDLISQTNPSKGIFLISYKNDSLEISVKISQDDDVELYNRDVTSDILKDKKYGWEWGSEFVLNNESDKVKLTFVGENGFLFEDDTLKYGEIEVKFYDVFKDNYTIKSVKIANKKAKVTLERNWTKDNLRKGDTALFDPTTVISGSGGLLEGMSSNSGGDPQAYASQYKFNVSSITTGSTVNDAIWEIRVGACNGSCPDADYQVSRVDDQTWTASQSAASFLGQTNTTLDNSTFNTTPAGSTWLAVNVTNQTQDEVTAGSENVTFRLWDADYVPSTYTGGTNNGASDYFGKWNGPATSFDYDSDTGTSPPKLKITYTEPASNTAPTVNFVGITQTNKTNSTAYVKPEVIDFRVNATDSDGDLITVLFYHNGTSINITDPDDANLGFNNTNVSLGAGMWNISYLADDGTDTTQTDYWFEITLGTPTINLALNGTEADVTYTFSEDVNSTGWVSTGDVIETLTLYRNGTVADKYQVWMSGITNSNNPIDNNLATGGGIPSTFGYVNITGVDMENFWINYQRDAESSGTPRDTAIYDWSSSSFTNDAHYVEDAALRRNGTIYIQQGVNDTQFVSNNEIRLRFITAAGVTEILTEVWLSRDMTMTDFNGTFNPEKDMIDTSFDETDSDLNFNLGVAGYNYTLLYNQTENYTESSVTRIADVNQQDISISLSPSTSEILYPNTATPQCTTNASSLGAIGVCSLWINDTAGDRNVTSEQNNTAIRYGAGGVLLRSNVTADTTNYSWTEQDSTLTVTPRQIAITLSPATSEILYPATETPYCSSNASTLGGQCSLFINDTAGGRNITAEQNNTAIRYGIGGVLLTANITGDTTNNTWTEATSTLTVTPRAITVGISPGTQTITYETQITPYCSSNASTLGGQCSLFDNITAGSRNITSWLNNTAVAYGVGGVLLTANITGDTTNNTWTEATSTQTIDKKTVQPDLTTSAESGNYPASITASCSLATIGNQVDCVLKRNSTDVTSAENNTAIELSAGRTVYITDGSGNANYTANATAETINVDIARQGMLLGISPSTQTITYETQITPYCNSNVSALGDISVCSLFRDDINATAGENNTATTYGADNSPYTFISNVTANVQNYTWTSQTFTLTVSKGNTTSTLYLNDTSADRFYEYGSTANITAVSNASDTVQLDMNASGYGINFASGTQSHVNYTDTGTLDIVGGINTSYNVTGYFPDNSNYTASSQSLSLYVDDTVLPDVVSADWNSSYMNFNSSAKLMVNISEENVSSVIAQADTSGGTSNFTLTLESNGNYTYNFTSADFGTQQANASYINITIITNDTSNNIVTNGTNIDFARTSFSASVDPLTTYNGDSDGATLTVFYNETTTLNAVQVGCNYTVFSTETVMDWNNGRFRNFISTDSRAPDTYFYTVSCAGNESYASQTNQSWFEVLSGGGGGVSPGGGGGGGGVAPEPNFSLEPKEVTLVIPPGSDTLKSPESIKTFRLCNNAEEESLYELEATGDKKSWAVLSDKEVSVAGKTCKTFTVEYFVPENTTGSYDIGIRAFKSGKGATSRITLSVASSIGDRLFVAIVRKFTWLGGLGLIITLTSFILPAVQLKKLKRFERDDTLRMIVSFAIALLVFFLIPS